jgi:hypothetical protein
VTWTPALRGLERRSGHSATAGSALRRHSDEAPASWYEATVWTRGPDGAVWHVGLSAQSSREAEEQLDASYGRGNYLIHLRAYEAIIWTRDDEPGERVTVRAPSPKEAREELEGAYGQGNVVLLPIKEYEPR